MKQKAFFVNLKGLSVATNCVRPESAPLRESLHWETSSGYNVFIAHF